MKFLRLQLLKSIAKFLYLKLIKGNALLLISSIVIGICTRFLVLIGFAMTLQAFVAAIKPEIFINISNQVLAYIGLNLEVQAEALVPLLITIILTIYALNWLLHIVRSKLLKTYISHVVGNNETFRFNRTMTDDVFMVEEIPPVIQSMVKSLEIIMFMFLVIILISILVPILVLLLLPTLILLVFIQVVADRAKLRDLEQQKKARQRYLNYQNTDGKFQRRTMSEDSKERDDYLLIRDKRRHKALIKPQFDTLVGTIATSIIIYYLFMTQLRIEQLAGLLIVFVVGVRNVIASGRELSVNISRVLELRKHIPVLERFIKNV